MGQIPFGLKLVRHKSRPFPVGIRGLSVDGLTICIVGFLSLVGLCCFLLPCVLSMPHGSSLPHPAGAYFVLNLPASDESLRTVLEVLLSAFGLGELRSGRGGRATSDREALLGDF